MTLSSQNIMIFLCLKPNRNNKRILYHFAFYIRCVISRNDVKVSQHNVESVVHKYYRKFSNFKRIDSKLHKNKVNENFAL